MCCCTLHLSARCVLQLINKNLILRHSSAGSTRLFFPFYWKSTHIRFKNYSRLVAGIKFQNDAKKIRSCARLLVAFAYLTNLCANCQDVEAEINYVCSCSFVYIFNAERMECATSALNLNPFSFCPCTGLFRIQIRDRAWCVQCLFLYCSFCMTARGQCDLCWLLLPAKISQRNLGWSVCKK
jgi:hypothetical protein